MNTTETTTARQYTVVYARGAAHIQGLDEKVHTSADSLNYAYSACPALTKNKVFWCKALTTSDLAAAVEKAELLARAGIAKGVCKKCLKTAREVVAAQVTETEPTIPGEWEQDVPGDDGTDVWAFSTEYGDHAEDYYAEVTGSGPWTWTVGECFTGGRELERGQADTLEAAQQAAVLTLADILDLG